MAESHTGERARSEQILLDRLFLEGRTHTAWKERPVADLLLQEIYEMARMGPTSANSCPARFVFVKGAAAKARLLPCINADNTEKVRSAPVTVIVAWDVEFYEQLPILFPHVDARSWFADDPSGAATTAFRNSSLQGAYLMLAARTKGLDVGPMSGFDADKLNAEFFPDGKWVSNFIFNLGYGDARGLHPRNPRLPFAQACRIE
jgi:3-hydroxypropanoate dehydrogenase